MPPNACAYHSHQFFARICNQNYIISGQKSNPEWGSGVRTTYSDSPIFSRSSRDARSIMVPAHWGPVPCMCRDIPTLVRAVRVRYKIYSKKKTKTTTFGEKRRRRRRRGVVYMRKYICMIGNPRTFCGLGGVPMGVVCACAPPPGCARARVRERHRQMFKNTPRCDAISRPHPLPPLRLETNFILRHAPGLVSMLPHRRSRT